MTSQIIKKCRKCKEEYDATYELPHIDQCTRCWIYRAPHTSIPYAEQVALAKELGAMEMFKDKLNIEFYPMRAEAIRYIKELNKRKATNADNWEDWHYEISIKIAEDNLETISKEIAKWEMWLSIAKGSEPKRLFDLEAVKQIPIGSLISTPARNQGSNRVSYHCPLHNERTASFVWFKDKNRFHCFGCQANGTVIDLYMKLNNIDFVNACKELAGIHNLT